MTESLSQNPFERPNVLSIDEVLLRINTSCQEQRATRESCFEQVLKKAREVIELDRIRIDDFTSYSDIKRRDDKLKVKQLKERFSSRDIRDRHSKEIAEIIEAVLMHQIEMNNWLGADVQTRPTTDYDDFINHVDMLLFQEGLTTPDHVMGLAIDVTFSSDLNSVRGKIDRIKEGLSRLDIGKIDYFTDGDDDLGVEPNYKGEIFNVPRVIVGVGSNNIPSIVSRWNFGKGRQLEHDPLRAQIIIQILGQLKVYNDFLKHSVKPRNPAKKRKKELIIKKINFYLKHFLDLLNSQRSDFMKSVYNDQGTYFENDPMYRSLNQALLDTFGKELPDKSRIIT